MSISINKELTLQTKLSHFNIVRVYGFTSYSNGDRAIAFELMEGGHLKYAIEKKLLNEQQKFNCIFQIASALRYLHSMSPPLVHGDLKPENILLTRNSIGDYDFKLTDFGISNTVGMTSSTVSTDATVVGVSYHYSSPDVLSSNRMVPVSDMFSFGSVIYFIYNGVDPFANENIMQITRSMIAGAMPRCSPGINKPFWYDELTTGLWAFEQSVRWNSTTTLEFLSRVRSGTYEPKMMSNRQPMPMGVGGNTMMRPMGGMYPNVNGMPMQPGMMGGMMPGMPNYGSALTRQPVPNMPMYPQTQPTEFKKAKTVWSKELRLNRLQFVESQDWELVKVKEINLLAPVPRSSFDSWCDLCKKILAAQGGDPAVLRRVRKIWFVHGPKSDVFEHQIRIISKRMMDNTITGNFRDLVQRLGGSKTITQTEMDIKKREAIYKVYQNILGRSFTVPDVANTGAVLGYHGTRDFSTARSIASKGIVPAQKLDQGYFGIGCYSTSSIKYALEYAKYVTLTDGSNSRVKYICVMLCCMGNTYPVIETPVNSVASGSAASTRPMVGTEEELRATLLGKPIRPAYTSHFSVVRKYDLNKMSSWLPVNMGNERRYGSSPYYDPTKLGEELRQDAYLEYVNSDADLSPLCVFEIGDEELKQPKVIDDIIIPKPMLQQTMTSPIGMPMTGQQFGGIPNNNSPVQAAPMGTAAIRTFATYQELLQDAMKFLSSAALASYMKNERWVTEMMKRVAPSGQLRLEVAMNMNPPISPTSSSAPPIITAGQMGKPTISPTSASAAALSSAPQSGSTSPVTMSTSPIPVVNLSSKDEFSKLVDLGKAQNGEAVDEFPQFFSDYNFRVEDGCSVSAKKPSPSKISIETFKRPILIAIQNISKTAGKVDELDMEAEPEAILKSAKIGEPTIEGFRVHPLYKMPDASSFDVKPDSPDMSVKLYEEIMPLERWNTTSIPPLEGVIDSAVGKILRLMNKITKDLYGEETTDSAGNSPVKSAKDNGDSARGSTSGTTACIPEETVKAQDDTTNSNQLDQESKTKSGRERRLSRHLRELKVCAETAFVLSMSQESMISVKDTTPSRRLYEALVIMFSNIEKLSEYLNASTTVFTEAADIKASSESALDSLIKVTLTLKALMENNIALIHSSKKVDFKPFDLITKDVPTIATFYNSFVRKYGNTKVRFEEKGSRKYPETIRDVAATQCLYSVLALLSTNVEIDKYNRMLAKLEGKGYKSEPDQTTVALFKDVLCVMLANRSAARLLEYWKVVEYLSRLIQIPTTDLIPAMTKTIDRLLCVYDENSNTIKICYILATIHHVLAKSRESDLFDNAGDRLEIGPEMMKNISLIVLSVLELYKKTDQTNLFTICSMIAKYLPRSEVKTGINFILWNSIPTMLGCHMDFQADVGEMSFPSNLGGAIIATKNRSQEIFVKSVEKMANMKLTTK